MPFADAQTAPCSENVVGLGNKVTTAAAKYNRDCENKATVLYEKYKTTANAPPASATSKECDKYHCTAIMALLIDSATGDDATKSCFANVTKDVQAHCLCRPKLNEISNITTEVANKLGPTDPACFSKAAQWYVDHEGQFETMMNALPPPPPPQGQCHKPWCDAAKLLLDTKKGVPADRACATKVQEALNGECDKPDGTQ